MEISRKNSVVALALALTTVTLAAQDKRTPWGDPDLQGVWDNHTTVPMQRPANLAGKKTFTDAELAARAKTQIGGGYLGLPPTKTRRSPHELGILFRCCARR